MFNKLENTKKFYDDLILKKNRKTFFTFEKRFEQNKILKSKNINRFFDDIVKKHIKKNDKILDFGCGSGAFTFKISKFTSGEVIGIDIAKEFIRSANVFFKPKNIRNLKFKLSNTKKLKFKDNYFNKILLVDVIHHLDKIKPIILELKRILKKNGKIIVYEPNKLNPLIFLIHLIEKNERGLLRVGSKKKYIEICKEAGLKLKYYNYNGIIIGPESILFKSISNLLNSKKFKILSWLNPKIFFIIEKI
jgi:ubiquinone/menaquinone biosynthesis C-methylase UbiE